MRWLVPAALISLVGCERCSPTPHRDVSVQAPATTEDAFDPAEIADVPEVRDTGPGRATAALRAALTAYGIPFDAATLERDCKVDETGASIDDLEEVAKKYGIDASQIMIFPEHVLLPQSQQLPSILIIAPPAGTLQFWLAWRAQGDRVQVMDPAQGRRWMPRSQLQKLLHIHEMAVPTTAWQETIRSSWYKTAERTRMMALGIGHAHARTLLTRAAGIPGWRGLGALDAAIRSLEAPPQAGHAPAHLTSAFECALQGNCAGEAFAVPPELWSVRPAPRGPENEEQLLLRGAVAVTLARRRPRAPM